MDKIVDTHSRDNEGMDLAGVSAKIRTTAVCIEDLWDWEYSLREVNRASTPYYIIDKQYCEYR